MELTEDDVLEILKLFEQSKFDFLQLQQGERKITVSKGGYVPPGEAPLPIAAQGASAAAPPSSPIPAASAQTAAKPAAAATEDLIPITAPMVGKFYSAPSPSDPPYVQEGSVVAAGATVGLIEVMKVFTSIKTEIAGTIERVLVGNGDFVEFGRPLFLIRPGGASRS
ncbi:MAG TPA: acetyl-CoA carboxylase biotin carboxyl carrier protein [Xanthobacteraceae bacterium]|jgi:acetyl-CoA carboxylase biotin carboxyl carrier protein